jgi:hypothetical protein
MISALFPTLLALYATIALYSADLMVRVYTGATDGEREPFETLLPVQRFAFVVAAAALWPLTLVAVLTLAVVATGVTAWARRGL